MVIRKTNSVIYLIFLSFLLFITSCKQEVFTENTDQNIKDACSIYVNSNPVGAKIYLDNKFTGYSTPDTIKWLSSNNHRVTLRFPLIRDTSMNVIPAVSTVKSVYVDYFASPRNYGSIVCESVPNNAAIYLNGTNVNKITPNTLPYLFPGIYNVKYRYPQYRDDSSAVTVYGGSASYLRLLLQDTTVWIDYRITNSNIPSNKIIALDADKNNNVWVGTLDNGVAMFNKGRFTRYNTSNSGIPYNFVTCLKVDLDNNIWIGTIYGLAKFDGVNWTVFNKSNSNLPSNYITTIHCSADRKIWIGTEKGLTRIDGNNVIVYTSQISPLLQNYVSGITSDQSGRLWVASGGISVLFNDIWKIYTRSSDGLLGFDTGSIAADLSGNIWCAFPENPKSGIAGGLMKFNGTNWREVSVPLIPKGRIQSIYVDQKGSKWISSAIGFLIIKPDDTQTVYKSNDYAMTSFDARDVTIDKNNNAWIALFGGGIVKWKQPNN